MIVFLLFSFVPSFFSRIMSFTFWGFYVFTSGITIFFISCSRLLKIDFLGFETFPCFLEMFISSYSISISMFAQSLFQKIFPCQTTFIYVLVVYLVILVLGLLKLFFVYIYNPRYSFFYSSFFFFLFSSLFFSLFFLYAPTIGDICSIYMYQDSQDTIIRPHVWTQRLEDLSHIGEYQYKRGEVPLRNGGKGVEGPTPPYLKSIIPQDLQERHFWTMALVVTLLATAGFVYLSMNVPHCADALSQYEKFFKFLKESKSYPWSWTHEEWMKILRSEQGGGMKGLGEWWHDLLKKYLGSTGDRPPKNLLSFYKK